MRCLFAILPLCVASAALPPEPPLQPNPLEGVTSALRAFAAAAAAPAPTGFTRQTYLDTITGIVNWFLPHQNATTGAIIDPATHEEMEYATPCWAHAAATLVARGGRSDLLAPASLALSCSIGQLAHAVGQGKGCATASCDFFMVPVMRALDLLSPLAPWLYSPSRLVPKKGTDSVAPGRGGSPASGSLLLKGGTLHVGRRAALAKRQPESENSVASPIGPVRLRVKRRKTRNMVPPPRRGGAQAAEKVVSLVCGPNAVQLPRAAPRPRCWGFSLKMLPNMLLHSPARRFFSSRVFRPLTPELAEANMLLHSPARRFFSSRVFRPLTPELAEATVACVAETMSQPEEPFTHALNLKRHHWHSLIIPFVERAAHAPTPLSVVAVNPATGRVDGCMLTEDWLAPRPLAYRMNIYDEWAPVRSIFSELHMRYQAVEGQPRAGNTLRVLYFSCVRAAPGHGGGERRRARARPAPPHKARPLPHPPPPPFPQVNAGARREGIMRGLWRSTADVARDNAYSAITAQATTQATRDAFSTALGFREVASVSFADFEVGGSKVFAALAARKPSQDRVSVHKKLVPSDLYV